MNIAQISAGLDVKAAKILSILLPIYNFIRMAEFRKNTYQYIHDADKSTFTNSAARALNGPAVRDAQAPNKLLKALALYSREISVDKAVLSDLNVNPDPSNLNSFYDNQLNSLCDKIMVEVQNDMVAGTGASNKMLGLLNIIKDADAAGQTDGLLGYENAELAARNKRLTLSLSDVDDQNQLVEEISLAKAMVPGANLIVAGESMAARLTTIARRQNAQADGIDSFGQQVAVFDRTPIAVVPDAVLGFSMNSGAETNTSSIFVLRNAEYQGVCFSTNSGLQFKDFDQVESTVAGVAHFSFNLNTTVEKLNAIYRISGIKR